MLVYFVKWVYDPKLGKGTGRLKLDDKSCSTTVLCYHSSQAIDTLYWLFKQHHLCDGVSIDDGEISCKRVAIDSRNIVISYLMLDGMKEPLYLPNIPSNYKRISNIFQIPTFY